MRYSFGSSLTFERGLTTVLGATPEEHIAACQSGLIPEEAYWEVVACCLMEPSKRDVRDGENGVTVWQVVDP